MSPSFSKDLDFPADRRNIHTISRCVRWVAGRGRWVAACGRRAEQFIAQTFRHLASDGPTNSEAPIVAAPIMRLPNEILAEIFYQGNILSQEDAELRSSICLVSRHWRDVAINTSSLWTRLDVKPSHSAEFIAMYLQRSKDRPLVIRVERSYYDRRDDFRRIFPLLTSSAYRWHELIIDVFDDQVLQLILRSLHDVAAPVLEIISISGGFRPPHDTINRIFTRGAPRLSNVSLDGINLRCCWPPMDHVTTFHINGGDHGFDGSEFYEMLEALHSITDLRLQKAYGRYFLGGFQKKVGMLSLRCLMIHAGIGGIGVNDYLQQVLTEAISAPKLETLVIVGGSRESISNASTSVAAPPAKFPALTSLELWDSCSGVITRDFLESLPSVKELSFIRSGDEGIQLLLDEEGGSNLLPELHTLTFESTLVFSDHDRKVADYQTTSLLHQLVASRARLGIPIQKLRLDSRLYTVDPGCIRWIQEYSQVENHGTLNLEWC